MRSVVEVLLTASMTVGVWLVRRCSNSLVREVLLKRIGWFLCCVMVIRLVLRLIVMKGILLCVSTLLTTCLIWLQLVISMGVTGYLVILALCLSVGGVKWCLTVVFVYRLRWVSSGASNTSALIISTMNVVILDGMRLAVSFVLMMTKVNLLFRLSSRLFLTE